MKALIFLLFFCHVANASDFDAYRASYESLFTGTIPNSTSFPQTAEDAFKQITTLVFSKPTITFQIVNDQNLSARYQPEDNSIVISQIFIELIQTKFPTESPSIFSFVIAHEISHSLLESYCNQSSNKKTPADQMCSTALLNENGNIPDEIYYEYMVNYSLEHLEVDYMAFLILQKLQVPTSAIYSFLNTSPVPWAQSRRLSDVLKAERIERINQAKTFR